MIAIGALSANFFQGTGKPGQAIFQNLTRQVLLLIPMLLLMGHIFGLKGIFLAAPISDTGAALLGLFLLRKELKKMPHQDF